MKQLIIFYWLCAIVACSRYPGDVERALKLAGDNRVELEKVLANYGHRPEDSLKLQSAYFLIANMPYHFTAYNARIESFKTYVRNNNFREGFLADYEKTYGPISGSVEIQPDLSQITSGYLIRNIDFSFQIWQETPWGSYFSFEQFCEHILPYRLSNEPLEDWKEAYYAVFRPVIDSMAVHCEPDEISTKLIEHIKNDGWNYEDKFQSHGFGASILLERKYGNCKELAEYIAFALRSVGIPSGIDCYIQCPNYSNISHFWNYRYTDTDVCFTFDFYDAAVANNRRMARQLGRVYRQCHALQKESLPVKHKGLFIPSGGLGDLLLRDVSSEYFPDTHISVRLASSVHLGRSDLAYLCVFNNKDWIPVTWSKPKNGVAEFRNVEPNILYQIRLIDEKRNVAASSPFAFHGNENVQYMDADTTGLQSMTLLRKCRTKFELPGWIYRTLDGKFQGANRPDFSDAVTLHTIQKPADYGYVDIHPEHPGKFLYVRYLSAIGGHNNMAEVKFYSGGKVLHGEVIGTDGAKEVFPNSTKYAVFDNDPLSFFDALEADGAWSGLELDKAYPIDAIRYIFRNDDNNIRPGDTYELLYHSAGQWLSAGIQTADTTLLHFENVPSNTLYWLHNHTRGKEERPFTYENEQQVWW